MIAQTSCPDLRWWQDFLDGTLSAAEQDGSAKHLDACPRCLQTLEQLTADSHSWPAAARRLVNQQATAAPALSRVMHELKSEGSRPDALTHPCADSHDTLPFLQPSQEVGHLGRLGAYEILEVIGRGGMGVVLKALDPALHRLVAIKVLAPQWATSGAARRRFAREARATAAVRHDHVVAVYAVEEAEGLPYLVMEYVHGSSLQQRLDLTGPLDIEEIVRIGMQTAAGLAAAHAQGLIHRDVKPANILLEHGLDRVKLSDFGLARAMDDASLTQSGTIAGTPQYMAPEQACGAAQDHRADLFSLGSVLYAACTGQPPFRAPTTLAVLRRVCEDTPHDIQEFNPEIPDWLVEIVDILHAKDPTDRFQTAAEVSDLLAQYLAHLQNPRLIPQPGRLSTRRYGRSRSRGRRRWAWAAGVFGLVIVPGLWFLPSLLGPNGGKANNSEQHEKGAQQPAPADNKAGGQLPGPAATKPWVVLTGGKVTRKLGNLLEFQVHYRFQQGSPAGATKWRWVVQSAGTKLHDQILVPAALSSEGTLHGSGFQFGLMSKGPIETYLVIDKLAPGQIGWQSEAASNVLQMPAPKGVSPLGK